MAKKLGKILTRSFGGPVKEEKTPFVGKSADIWKLPSVLQASFEGTNSAHSINFCLSNTGSEPWKVNVQGGYLNPSGNVQRLFIAGLYEERGTEVVVLPGEMKKVRLACCCMDQGKPSPTDDVEYTLNDQKAPESMIEAAKKFVEERFKAKKIDVRPVNNVAKDDANLGVIFPNDTIYEGEHSLHYVQAVCWGTRKP